MTPAAATRLAEIAATQAALAAEAQRLIAEITGAGPGAGETVTPSVNIVHERSEPDAPSPEAQQAAPEIDLSNLVALKVAAARWGRSVRNIKKIAADHGALAKVGGRNMVDHKKLQNAIFARL